MTTRWLFVEAPPDCRKFQVYIGKLADMHQDPKDEQDPQVRKTAKGLPTWFKLAAVVLTGLIILKVTGLEVFVEVTYDGNPFLAALTDIRFYFVPLLLILIYILSTWIWKKYFGSDDT